MGSFHSGINIQRAAIFLHDVDSIIFTAYSGSTLAVTHSHRSRMVLFLRKCHLARRRKGK